jgi:hypothetical protein
VPDGPLDPEVDAAVQDLFGINLASGIIDNEALRTIGASGDARLAWLLADLLRFTGGDDQAGVRNAATALTGLELNEFTSWGELTDHLIGWDTPAPPDYVETKRRLFLLVEPQWGQFFEPEAEADGRVDYRVWSWGGVGIDDRPFGRTDERCNCIPAADNPAVTDAAGGDWYDDDRVVFGVEINGEARAYPRNIMEIREMVNDTLGGRSIAMPYCTLCGSAQVYFTDELPDGIERPVLRTSGLLTRSNKVMYDVTTFSVFDTFLGEAVTGPLADEGLVLEQATVVTTTWGDWKAAHPDTTILDESLALGRDSDLLNTRDADGPIFPIGDVDPRLPIQEPILGVIAESGTPYAVPVAAALSHLRNGGSLSFENVEVVERAGGIAAVDADGSDLGTHQAFWFAWSQFHPDTEVALVP